MSKQIAEALVECGYATVVDWHNDILMIRHSKTLLWSAVCPMKDTLEGRRQADALAEWFFNKHRGMWDALQFMKRDEPYNNHEHLCKQLRTGFEQLEAQRCPDCGYTEADAILHADHNLCKNKNPPWVEQAIRESKDGT